MPLDSTALHALQLAGLYTENVWDTQHTLIYEALDPTKVSLV